MGKEKVISKMHFIRAAEIVKSIRVGDWTMEPPSWITEQPEGFEYVTRYVRAVQTAEAFLLLFKEYNPRFDEQRFLIACGLIEKLAKGGKR